MLTASQCEIVAFVTDGGIICRECAQARYGEMGVAALEEGLAEFLPQDVSCLIRYELDTIIGDDASNHADEEIGRYDLLTDSETLAWQEAFDNYPAEYACDECGGGIS